MNSSSDIIAGMNDEEELRRISAGLNGAAGLGEESLPVVDFSQDLDDLGIRNPD